MFGMLIEQFDKEGKTDHEAKMCETFLFRKVDGLLRSHVFFAHWGLLHAAGKKLCSREDGRFWYNCPQLITREMSCTSTHTNEHVRCPFNAEKGSFF